MPALVMQISGSLSCEQEGQIKAQPLSLTGKLHHIMSAETIGKGAENSFSSRAVLGLSGQQHL